MQAAPATARRLGAAALIVAGMVLLALIAGWGIRQRVARAPENIVLALALQAPSALVFVACERGYLAEEGLKAEVTEHVSGSRALAALLAGEADVTTAADVPVVFNSFTQREFRILAAIGASGNEQRLVARKDRGIAAPADLRGKRVGTQPASAVHFFLHCFLLHYGLDEQEVAVVFQKAESLPESLAEGTIDAFAMREPYVSEAVRRLGPRAAVFAAPGLYLRTELLVAARRLIETRPDAAIRLLRALLRAEEFAREQPRAAMAIAARRLKIGEAELAALWPDLDLRVGLDQSLLPILENEARWALRHRLVPGTEVPNYLPFIHLNALEQVKPEAVTIIH
jgi:NitT/TauT family transport system substrate-binding protein